jgi:hypothetical protein
MTERPTSVAQKVTAIEKEYNYKQTFLFRLSQKLATPTSEWPTVRCWSKPKLDRVFKQVREELAKERMKTALRHVSLLEWICQLGLCSPLSVDGESIYLLEIGATAEAEVDPLELLMASKPAGVICYFSAVAFHGLTTQLVQHHHVAEMYSLERGQETENAKREGLDRHEPTVSAGSRAPRRWTLLFHYQGVPFYITRRSARLVPGVQTRNYGPRTRLRITTLEQTLLDTLYKPFYCGGPEVVFEAWQEAVASRRMDEERLVEYLRAMNYPASTRRIGVMLGLVGWSPGEELRRLLEACQAGIDRQSPYARISLLPGVVYQNLNESWLVNTP